MQDFLIHPNLGINNEGHLTVSGQDTVALASQYGTPLYLLDEQLVRANCRAYVNTIRECFPEGSMPLLASKALSFTGIYKIAASEGMGTDLVSSGELYTAKKAGFPLEKAFFHGNNKTDADIAFAMDCGVGYFVVDNLHELQAVHAEACRRGIRQKILLRLTPGIDPHTHKAITTGTVDSKFGSVIENGQAEVIVLQALALDGIDLRGFHCHVGSQVFEIDPFVQAAEIMLRFIKEMQTKHGYTAEFCNLGGGFGARYLPSHPTPDYAAYIRSMAAEIKKICDALLMDCPKILLEPGRSIVAAAGTTLYTAGSVKHTPNGKTYVSVDGGMPDNPRYALYEAPYTLVNASRADKETDCLCSVVGRCCESGDILQENLRMASADRGDIIAVLTTGAYNYSMASNYNRLPRPALIILNGNENRVGVRRETFEDLVALDEE